MNAQAHVDKNAHANTHTHTHTHTYTDAHIHTHTDTNTLTHTHIHTHTQTHKRPGARSRIHAHTSLAELWPWRLFYENIVTKIYIIGLSTSKFKTVITLMFNSRIMSSDH